MQNEIILKLLDAHLNNKEVKNIHLSLEEWDELLTKCHQQSILPLVYETVLSLLNENDKAIIKRKYNMLIIKDVALQVQKTEIFLKLYNYLTNNGIKPIVVKGLVCRNMYPSPDFRVSSDEDILVREKDYKRCVELMRDYDMMIGNDDIEHAEEIKVMDSSQLLLIEMHKVLFPGESIVNVDWNTLFMNTYDDLQIINVKEQDVYSLSHTNHMLYLLLHLFKHFLHSGVGIRQVCDIMMYARNYGSAINWEYIEDKCKDINADIFMMAILKICHKYLSLDLSSIPSSFDLNIDELDLLEDILSGGVFGALDKEELHGGTYMMNKAKHGKFALLKTLFPSLKEMQGKVDYLNDKPYLLPIAWIIRIFDYLRGGNLKAYSQGKTRSELLKKYKVER